MPQNLELKAPFSSARNAERIARRLRARRCWELFQKDTYFDLPAGRLKLREAAGRPSELIWYIRPNRLYKRYSNYTIVPVKSPGETKRVLKALLGIKVIVKKRRIVYLYENARIHIDRVSGLGEYIEFEVIVRKGKSQAERMMKFLRNEFGIRKSDHLRWSYSDLLLKTNGSKR